GSTKGATGSAHGAPTGSSPSPSVRVAARTKTRLMRTPRRTKGSRPSALPASTGKNTISSTDLGGRGGRSAGECAPVGVALTIGSPKSARCASETSWDDHERRPLAGGHDDASQATDRDGGGEAPRPLPLHPQRRTQSDGRGP